nr:reverse transcriptase domain-containing protein [Tanacetum cinerariifolium]
PSPNYIPGPEEPETPPVSQDEDEREPMFIQPHDPKYVVVSDPEEDPEEYEDDELEDGPVDYLMDGGDDGDDGGDSSGDDVDDEEDEEEHFASAGSSVVVPTVEPVSPPGGTEPAEVERLLAMPTPPPSPLTSISPPSIGERLVRCTAPSAHSSPPLVPSPLMPSSGCPTQIQTLGIASTHALINAITVALPSPPLPPLPPFLYIPPPVDRRDDVLESELPPRKRSCLSTLGSRYEIGENSTARPTRGRGIDYGFVSTLDAEVRRQGIREFGYGIRDTWVDPTEAVPEIAPMTLGEVNTRVTELAELHDHDTQDLYALLEDAQDSKTRISQRGPNTPPNNINPNNMTPEFFQAMIDQALLRNSTNEDGSHSLDGDNLVSTGCAIENQVKFATYTVLGATLTWWNYQIRTLGPDAYTMTWEILKKKMKDKYCPQGEIKKLEIKLWNLKVKGNDVSTYTVRFQELTLICTKFVANETKKIDKYISGLLDNIYGSVKASKPKTLDETIELANDLMDQKLCTYAERQTDNKRKADDSSRNNHGHQQHPSKRQNDAKVYNMGAGERKPYGGNFPKNETLIFCGDESNDGRESRLTIISSSKAQEYIAKGCQIFLAQISAKKEEDKSEGKQLKDVPIVQDFLEVFLEDLLGLPLTRPVEFQITLIPRAHLLA